MGGIRLGNDSRVFQSQRHELNSFRDDGMEIVVVNHSLTFTRTNTHTHTHTHTQTWTSARKITAAVTANANVPTRRDPSSVKIAQLGIPMTGRRAAKVSSCVCAFMSVN